MKPKKVVVVGAGAIGCFAARRLARETVSVKIIDRDFVERSNLGSQVLYSEKDVGLPKSIAAKRKLEKISEACKVSAVVADLDWRNASLLEGADVVLDCTDNLEARFLINDYCMAKRIPWVYAGAVRGIATVYPVVPDAPCFRCIFEGRQSAETCDTAGVLVAAVRSAAGIQARQAIGILQGKRPEQAMIRINLEGDGNFKVRVRKNGRCPSCRGRYDYLRGRRGSKVVKMCGSGSYQIRGAAVDIPKLAERLKGKGVRVRNLRYCLHANNVTVFRDGRALIKADTPEKARSVYFRIFG